MSRRDEFLNRLRTSFECKESWDGMQGSASCRFCSQCQREVVDFSQLTAREVRTQLQATRGKMCARLTFQGGRLLLQQKVEPQRPPRRRPARRVSPVAATLLGAWLSAGSVAAQPNSAASTSATSTLEPTAAESQSEGERRRAEQEKAGAGNAALRGKVLFEDAGGPLPGAKVVAFEVLSGRERRTVTDDRGAFLFEHLPAGVYDLYAELDGVEVEHQQDLLLEDGRIREANLKAKLAELITTVGILLAPDAHLLDLYRESDLVVSAIVGESFFPPGAEGSTEVETQLHIVRRIKGSKTDDTILLRHSEWLEAADNEVTDEDEYGDEDEDEDDGEVEDAERLKPGDEILVFLSRAEEVDPEGRTLYEIVGYELDFLHAEKAVREAYRERTEALAELEEAARDRDSLRPAELVEWMVATAENRLTRNETISEIQNALETLQQRASREGKDSAVLAQELRQAVTRAGKISGAAESLRPIFLGAAITEQHRQRLTTALWATHSLNEGDRTLFALVGTWDSPAAMEWLPTALRAAEVSDDDLYWWVVEFADELRTEKATAFSVSAESRRDALKALNLDEDERDSREKALTRELMHELADLLEEEP